MGRYTHLKAKGTDGKGGNGTDFTGVTILLI